MKLQEQIRLNVITATLDLSPGGQSCAGRRWDDLRAQDRPWSGRLDMARPLHPCQRTASFKRGHGLCPAGGRLGSRAPWPQDLPLSPRKGRMRNARGIHICQQRRAEGVEVPASRARIALPRLSPWPWPGNAVATHAGVPSPRSPSLERPGTLEKA